ncbi:unnamed protein product [Kuraishia capsulata CBS 1993]|uniref:beta-N-acetylhexosaminidase n=1 Tax=Kuraishia capsulata CBS 1993 TaxID=1382522 RepID=W6MM25_9ASCO|nr:uncharacterized protein KUCA_T00001923001 [Kuraishia capsulata CBS 1993]CDK25952.1 unnamed protein product [Kuraishia capsulata CBS 1993]
MTVQSLLDQIDILAMAKMNVLHWHFVESQSWPIEMLKYPQMTNDAYSPEEIYTQEDIKKILKYGRERGVRIIPELDMPGHSSSGWRSVDPEIISCGDAFWCQSDKFHTSVEPNPGQLDIIYENTHEVLKDVYGELSGLFDDNLFHVGADEIVADCYNYSTHVQRWFAEDSSRTFRDLIQYWVDKTYPMFTGLKKDRRLIMWEDILTSDISAFNLSEEVIMQVWTNGPVHIKDLTSRGHDVIVSTSDYLYLDCGEASWLPNDPNFIDGFVGTPDTYNYNPGYGSSWCGPYKTYQRIYNYDIAANLTDEEAAHIIGGEVAIWAEQTDSLTLTSMVWPRSAAYAENLWSGNRDESGKRRNFVFTQRILNFREYLVALGFSAKALVPKYCLQHPHACDRQWDIAAAN